MTAVTLDQVHKSYGDIHVIKGVDLAIEDGEFVVFVGPSGCGKSTLLRMIAGLETISDGELQIAGARVNEVPPSQRGIAMVFQSYALYPHMSVYDNMAFGMRIAKASKAEIDERVGRAAEILQLTPYLDRLPKALSGGQRQRVAIGRAICRDPKVFLFDEPLSNLDAALRVATRIEIAKLKESMPDSTMIYVTHDQVEAMTLADRIVVLSAGHIEQVGNPIELYENPANLFVARFIGSPAMNIVPMKVESAGDAPVVSHNGQSQTLKRGLPDALAGQQISYGIRPEDLTLANGDSADFSGTITLVESLGEVTNVYADIGTAEPVVAKLEGIQSLHRGDPISLKANPEKVHLFNGDGKAIAR